MRRGGNAGKEHSLFSPLYFIAFHRNILPVEDAYSAANALNSGKV